VSKAAKIDYLETLHRIVAETITAGLKGEEVTPALIGQAIKFLKDNGIEPARDADNSALNSLVDAVNKIAADPASIKDFLN
jgi:hypothetical protein